MKIEWFKEEAKGTVTLAPYHLTASVSLKPYLATTDYVRIGIVDDKSFVIQPVRPENEEKAKAMGEMLLKVSRKKSYDRISGVALCRALLARFGLSESSAPYRFPCHIDEELGLVVEIEGGQ